MRCGGADLLEEFIGSGLLFSNDGGHAAAMKASAISSPSHVLTYGHYVRHRAERAPSASPADHARSATLSSVHSPCLHCWTRGRTVRVSRVCCRCVMRRRYLASRPHGYPLWMLFPESPNSTCPFFVIQAALSIWWPGLRSKLGDHSRRHLMSH